MTYANFDGILKPAIEGSEAGTIEARAASGKAVADSLLASGGITQEQHNIVYHNIDGWRNAFLNNTTPPDWEQPI